MNNLIMVTYKGFTAFFQEGDTESIKKWKKDIDES